ncbi:MAG: hypothetical protein LWX11_09655 [Firmicutes bacterium]|nr:hypothetical protein [Bacillota bacterium]
MSARSFFLAAALLSTTFVAFAQETPVVSLKEFVSAEVRGQGFTLADDAQIHIYARGGGFRPGRGGMWAYGWILDARTREVVWQMTADNSQASTVYRVADQYLRLPKGQYEAYFSNYGFGRDLVFMPWIRNVDRRRAPVKGEGFLALSGLDGRHLWQERAGNYGLEIAVASGSASSVQTFEAPLAWKNVVASSGACHDGQRWEQAFTVKKPLTLHIYALGEFSGSTFVDGGWITDTRTQRKVWEMTEAKAQYAGGGRKNRRQVETLRLEPGEYVATYVTDGSHSAADWNVAPPCDPFLYGLTLSVPDDAERSSFVVKETK